MKMANCCFCFKVRTGTYIIAILYLVNGVLSLIASSYSIVKNSERYYQDRLYSTEILLALIIGDIFFVVIQFILLYGLKRNRKRAILFWLVTQAICCLVKFTYCEKATKFEKNLTLLKLLVTSKQMSGTLHFLFFLFRSTLTKTRKNQLLFSGKMLTADFFVFGQFDQKTKNENGMNWTKVRFFFQTFAD